MRENPSSESDEDEDDESDDDDDEDDESDADDILYAFHQLIIILSSVKKIIK
jgi:hypothetical protein